MKIMEGIVDRLGEKLAQLADLQSEVDELKGHLKWEGAGAYEGRLYRATVSLSVRESLDMEAVREKLSPQFIAAHTVRKEVAAVRVVSRQGGAS